MAIMSTGAVVILLELSLSHTAGTMVLLSAWELLASFLIIVYSAKLLATLPTPATPTTSTYGEFVIRFKAACKNVVARGIF
jgi:hypothetical protein